MLISEFINLFKDYSQEFDFFGITHFRDELVLDKKEIFLDFLSNFHVNHLELDW